MRGFVVWVDFRLKPGARGRFRELVDANATASMRSEAGCRRFDVTEARGEPDRVLLYEIYDSEAAFEEHCRTAHFDEFNTQSAPLVVTKLVMTCDLVLEATH
ncbi:MULTISPECIES: putative quinol monooxygenase [unclassified Mesorhizobium]|uniref:putative quinol monooxygenase n=1 Tax=unclassified Mesorhizobium TaxID=325217 RepID=UPI0003D06CE9|nr:MULTISPECIES: putative quinol monooxygenase [unclassified Mesorhizobium]ESZ24832.1 antibiotic biosynthesis monooxygenase [Mesorhizobium sp. L2C084A000]RUW90774.1 antibiotic biosynthesis monooxygenase [Mesorhizobium sp. M7A.F.Ca.US.010.02.1.1]